MRRAWKQFVIILVLMLSPLPALAFQAGSDFDKAPGGGGGGGLFYTGAPAERGYTCIACHTNPLGKITVSVNDASNTLFTNFRYTPGTTYPLTATLDNDQTTIEHFNSLAVSVVDGSGAPVGTIGGFGADDFYQASSGTIVSAGKKPSVTSWTFSWTAPPTSAGRVHLHMTAVAGNAAGLPGLTLCDPWGDDAFAGTLDLDPDKTTGSRDAPGWVAFACVAFLPRRRLLNTSRRSRGPGNGGRR